MSRFRAAMMMVPALGLGLACTAILNPRDDVQRCGNPSDCEASGDERYDVVCKFPDGMMLDSTEVDKICVADFKPVSCDPENYLTPADHPYKTALDTLNMSNRYNCPMEQAGQLGCMARSDQTCDAGLVNVGGACDDNDPETVPLAGNADLFGQDIYDQFCRSFFCDDTFVCDKSDDRYACVQCDPDKPFGQGGCGTAVVGGGPSCVYSDECDAPDSSVDDPNFGTACM